MYHKIGCGLWVSVICAAVLFGWLVAAVMDAVWGILTQ
jgi:hypothetical protein